MPAIATPLKPLRCREEAEQNYRNLDKLLHKTVWQFKKLHGGCWEELRAEADWLFTKALSLHNPKKSKLSTWIRNCVWFGLLDFSENEKKWQERFRCNSFSEARGEDDETESDTEHPADHRGRFDLHRFLAELSEDAARVVLFALRKLHKMDRRHMKLDGQIRSNGAGIVRGKLLQALLDLGWAGEQVLATFREIGEALQ